MIDRMYYVSGVVFSLCCAGVAWRTGDWLLGIAAAVILAALFGHG